MILLQLGGIFVNVAFVYLMFTIVWSLLSVAMLIIGIIQWNKNSKISIICFTIAGVCFFSGLIILFTKPEILMPFVEYTF